MSREVGSQTVAVSARRLTAALLIVMSSQALMGLLLPTVYRDVDPTLTFGGILLWRRKPWGYVVAAIASIQAALYLFVLSINSVVAIQRGLANAPGELPIWGPLAGFMTIVAVVLLANIRHDRVGD